MRSVQLNFSQRSGALKDILVEMNETRPYVEPPAIQVMRERLSSSKLGGRVEHRMSLDKPTNSQSFYS